MAKYRTYHPGNTAIQQEVWTLSISEATKAATQLHCSPGSYWNTVLMKPLRRAKRAKELTVKVYTAGFSTGELSSVLWATGSTIREE